MPIFGQGKAYLGSTLLYDADAFQDFVTAQAWMTKAREEAAAEGFTTGFADSFEDASGIDSGASSNYDAQTGYVQPTLAAGAQISQATGSALNNATTRASNLYDGDTTQDDNNTAYRGSTSMYAGKDYSGVGGKTCGQVIVYGSTNSGFANGATANVTITIYGKNGSAPSNGTDGTAIGSLATFTEGTNESAGRAVDCTDPTTTYDYIWANVVISAGSGVLVAEVEIYEPGGVLAMDLRSNGEDLGATLAAAAIFLIVKDTGTLTLNTDLLIYASADDGTSWAAGTLEEVAVTGSYRVLQALGIDVSSHSDQVLALRAVTANGVMPQILDWAGKAEFA